MYVQLAYCVQGAHMHVIQESLEYHRVQSIYGTMVTCQSAISFSVLRTANTFFLYIQNSSRAMGLRQHCLFLYHLLFHLLIT